MSDSSKKYYGKYRGTVVSNLDPENRGRLTVAVTGVGGPLPSTWAMPCLPFAGPECGVFAVPPPGASVWVEFEQGDPRYPVWTGCFWETPAEVPPLAVAGAPGVQQVVLQTVLGNMLSISDTPGLAGGITLIVGEALITVTDTGILIDNGQGATIDMTGPTVSINGTALVVTLPMPGLLIQQGATVLCVHGGQAMAAVPNANVSVSGATTSVISGQWTIAGCPGIPPSIPPCVTAQWLTGTTRVTSNGQPLVIISGEATCMPNGTPLLPIVTQLRVTAT
jgi:hypothetical protein